MHDRFALAATVAGKLRRIELHPGDCVEAGMAVARIDPAPIEPRQEAVLQARLKAARAAQSEADALVARAKTEHDQAVSDLGRARRLFEQGVSAKESLERFTSAEMASAKQLEAAQSRSQAASHQVEEATAALMNHTGDSAQPVILTAPVSGCVLRLLEQSEKVVTPGMPILEIGYSPKLEVVSDFLTEDAVKIRSGMPALIEDWGGERPLKARVRMVEPGAFTKVSALGVDEQRVNVVLDFTDGSANLADAYRVEVRVITWQATNVLKLPSSALFRSGEEWAFFEMLGNTAAKRTIRVGHRSDREMEILAGTEEGRKVILHPTAELQDGSRVRLRD